MTIAQCKWKRTPILLWVEKIVEDSNRKHAATSNTCNCICQEIEFVNHANIEKLYFISVNNLWTAYCELYATVTSPFKCQF